MGEIDYTNPVTQVRLLINDSTTANPTFDAVLYSDDEVGVFLALVATQALGIQAAQVKLAAAMAVDAMADNEALVLKAITDNGLTTNGPAVANALRARATALRADAARDLQYAADGDSFFEFIPGRDRGYGGFL